LSTNISAQTRKNNQVGSAFFFVRPAWGIAALNLEAQTTPALFVDPNLGSYTSSFH